MDLLVEPFAPYEVAARIGSSLGVGLLVGLEREWAHKEVGVRVFSWQEGYGAFTVSPSHAEEIRRYIANQEEHHRVRSFQEEYLDLLREHGVEYTERYLW